MMEYIEHERRKEVITDGLPAGWEVQIDAYSRWPRPWSLVVGGVVVARGHDFEYNTDSDGIRATEPQAVSAIRSSLASCREALAAAHEARRAKFDRVCAAAAAKAEEEANRAILRTLSGSGDPK